MRPTCYDQSPWSLTLDSCFLRTGISPAFLSTQTWGGRRKNSYFFTCSFPPSFLLCSAFPTVNFCISPAIHTVFIQYSMQKCSSNPGRVGAERTVSVLYLMFYVIIKLYKGCTNCTVKQEYESNDDCRVKSAHTVIFSFRSTNTSQTRKCKCSLT